MCANGGIHLFTLMDWYSGSWSLLVLALLEVVIVAWLFGAERMLDLMQQRMNIWIPRPLHAYWRFTWRYLSPLCIVAILVFSVVQYVPAYYGTGDTRRDYPPWVNGLGWIISLAPILLVIIVAVYHLRTSKQGWRELLEATDGCGRSAAVHPALPAVETSSTDGNGGLANAAFELGETGKASEKHSNGASPSAF
ncbi:sodium-dependent dopamine transporter-like [Amphibalanus amphitrite]|uniref:sodium-dependent dopamine transporter-like n=1 Tax=Amphibalanus amphitrite TaxID=1232801 RepID=UPI001C921D81|nr:sodium-dependent dopamine transporter-like [Amphibalanus amphitrite]